MEKIKKTGDRQDALNVIEAYRDFDGFTDEECEAIGFSGDQCKTLQETAFAYIGKIYTDDILLLQKKGFSSEFISTLSGLHGNRLIEAKVEWLYKYGLKDSNPLVREKACMALMHIGGQYSKQLEVKSILLWALDALTEALKDEKSSVRDWAAAAIGNIGWLASEAVPALIGALEDKDPSVRESVAHAFACIGPDAKFAVPSLVKALKGEKSAEVREEIVLALGYIGHNSPRVTRALIATLKDKDAKVRKAAAWALGQIDPTAKRAVPHLITALSHDDDEIVRAVAADALGMIGDPRAIHALIKTVKEEDEDIVKVDAILALGNMGYAAEKAVSVLSALLKDESATIRSHSSRALGSIGSEKAVPALIAVLKEEEDFSLRAGAALALGWIGSDAESAIPALIEASRKDQEAVRERAIEALCKIGSTDPRRGISPASYKDIVTAVGAYLKREKFAYERKSVVRAFAKVTDDGKIPVLAAVLKSDSEWFVRAEAARGLGESGTAAVEAVPVMIEALEDKEEVVREAAARSLGRIGPQANAAIPTLINALKDEATKVRKAAADALGRMGRKAKAAVSALKETSSNDSSDIVCMAAEKALELIEGD